MDFKLKANNELMLINELEKFLKQRELYFNQKQGKIKILHELSEKETNLNSKYT